MVETLGVLAHRGGLVVERPELSVGIVRAVSRPTGLELELLARRPLDRRGAAERQADVRAGRAASPAAPRRLPPPLDEGLDLRAGWLDDAGRAHWEFGTWSSSSSGDHFEGIHGPRLRTAFCFPPMYDRVSLVLAWPEIGFPETVVDLPLPDRATVDRDTVSIWEAPLTARSAPTLSHRVAGFPLDDLAVEAGRVVATPQVLSRGDDAVVVLTRLTAVGQALSMEILSVATGDRADAISATAFPPPLIPDDPELLRTLGPAASIAVLHDRDAVWLRQTAGTAGGGSRTFHATDEFTLDRPEEAALDLVVAWPAAGLPELCVAVTLSEH